MRIFYGVDEGIWIIFGVHFLVSLGCKLEIIIFDLKITLRLKIFPEHVSSNISFKLAEG